MAAISAPGAAANSLTYGCDAGIPPGVGILLGMERLWVLDRVFGGSRGGHVAVEPRNNHLD